MPYTRGPYAEWTSLPSPTVTTIPAARKIMFSTRRYDLDSYGNYEGMDPTAQRVMLALSFSATAQPKLLTDRDLEKRRQQIDAALAVLVDEGAITVQRILVEAKEAGRGTEQVDFINRMTGKEDSVTRP